RGIWARGLEKSPWLQLVFGSLMGIIPGCLGSYTVVSLYLHRVVMFPALVATMIATSGDEAYLMFSMMPATAFKLNIILLIIAIASGFIVHFTVKNKYIGLKSHGTLPIHERNEECNHYHPALILENIRNISFVRALLVTGLVGLIVLFATGIIDGSHHFHTLMAGSDVDVHGHGHDHDHHHGEADWIRISLLLILSGLLYIVLIVKDHFLQDHLWQHIIKKHFHKIFLWTLVLLLLIHYANEYVNLATWITDNLWLVLLLALLIGIIPESGPHYIFVLLFMQGSLPFSILLASSIVQDGHGTLPLLAESRKGFIAVKLINLLVGLIFGAIGILTGF
ncbi:MAG: putative manganese transporter, partial [Bacteroidales bacterium]|nr:putative manganese transporter [Bacteroidales bacterium]